MPKMSTIWQNSVMDHIFALILVALVCPLASGSVLKVVYSPDSLRLSSGEPIESSSVADFISLSLGYSLPTSFEWKGVTAITDVFALPKTSFTVRVSGQDVVNSTLVFPIVQRTLLDEEFDTLSERTRQRFGVKSLIVKMDSIFDLNANEISGNTFFVNELTQNLKSSLESNHNFDGFDGKLNPEDNNIKNFILEIKRIRQTLESIKELKTNEGKSWPSRGVFWFEVDHLSAITESDDYDPRVKTEAKLLMSNLIEELKRDLIDIYDKRVIFSVIEDKQMFEPLVRKTRDTSSSPQSLNYTALNLAHQFQSDFHAAFAMVGFTTLLIALAVYGVSVAMWNLDPGKDSIIYRMTSQRIKKDQ